MLKLTLEYNLNFERILKIFCKFEYFYKMNLSEKILVTGAAGFIGSEIAKKLLSEGVQVVGVDNLNSYYNPSLKEKN